MGKMKFGIRVMGALALCLAMACSDDEGNKDGGGGDSPDASSGGTGGGDGGGETPVVCGGTECPSFEGAPVPLLACCTDEDMCSVRSAETDPCEPQAESEPGCEGVEILGMPVAGCCLDGECGINGEMFGMDCVSLDTLEMFVPVGDERIPCGGDGGADDAGSN